jgi:RNA methyltransferase, TrmH family
MASLDECRGGTEAQQGGCGALHGWHVVDYPAGQDCRLIYVRGYERCKGQQIVSDDILRLGSEKPGTRGGNHDRIHHKRSPPVLPNRACYLSHDGWLRQHASLESRGRQVFGECGELSADHRLRDSFHRAHTEGILRGQCHDHRCSEHTELVEGFQVGLNSGAAAGIRAGNRERDLHRVSICMSSSLQTLIRDLHRRRGRERRGLALAEGVRLVEEAIATDISIRGVAVSPALEATTRGKSLKAALLDRQIRVEEVTDLELDALTDTEHPQGVTAVIEPRQWSLADIRLTPGVTALVLDAVQDPGNVGTMLRTALGLAAAGVIALKGTADLTNPKVIRGGMGATFRLPSVAASPEELVAWSRLQRAEIWVAAVGGERLERLPRRSAERAPVLLVVGNEGAGVGATLEAAANRRIGISLAAGVDSLNVAVAAGILLHEVTRD